MLVKACLGLFGVLGLTLGLSQEGRSPANNPIDSEEYKVLGAVLDSSLLDVRGTKTPAVINRSTADPHSFKYDCIRDPKEPCLKIQRATLRDFFEKNSRPTELEKRIPTKRRYFLFGHAERRDFVGSGQGRKYLEDRYGTDCISRFSRVGFNRNRTQALAYEEYECDGASGFIFRVLVWRVGKWTIADLSGVAGDFFRFPPKEPGPK